MQMTKKITSIVLAVLMVVSMMSVMAVTSASAYDSITEVYTAMQEGGTITLDKDFTYGGTLSVPAGKTVTLDLAGHTLESTNNCAISNKGTLTIKDSVGGGQIIAQEACVLAPGSGAKTTINGGTYTSKDNGVFMANGSTGNSGNTWTIKAGTFNGYIETAGYVACGIYAANDDTWTISGGTFNIYNGVAIVQRAGTVKVTGGTFNVTGDGTEGKVGDSRVVLPSGTGIVYDSKAGYPGQTETSKTTVTGGTFTTTQSPVTQVKDSSDNTRITVSGGTFDNEVNAAYIDASYEYDEATDKVVAKTDLTAVWEWIASTNASYQYQAKLTLKDGDTVVLEKVCSPTINVVDDDFNYTASATNAGIKYTAPAKLVEANGVIKTTAELTQAAKTAASWELGNNLNNVGSTTVSDGFKLDGKGYTINANTNVLPAYYQFVVKDENTKFELSNVTLDGGGKRYGAVSTFKSGKGGVNQGTVVTLNDVTIQNYKSSDYTGAIYAFGSSTINLNDCTVTGNQNNTNAQKVNGAQVSADEAAAASGKDIWAGSKAHININGGTYGEVFLHSYSGTGATLDSQSATIDTVRLDMTKTDTLKANIASGTVNDIEANGDIPEEIVVIDPDDATVAAPAGYKWNDSEETGKKTLAPIEYVAQVGETKYESLEEAIAAISTVTSEYHSKSGLTINKYTANGTIKLLADCEGNGIVINSGSDLTIDFDGKTYNVSGDLVGSNGTESIGFQLLKDSDVTFKNGTITSDKAQMIIQNYSNLTLDKMTIDGTNMAGDGNYVLSNNNGNVVINDTTINARGGCIAFDVCRYASYPSVNVTVKGDSVINGNVEVFASKSDPKNGFSLTLESGTMTGDIILDKTAQNVIDTNPDKVEVTKKNTFTQEAPIGYEWVDNGDGTSSIAPTTYPLDELITKASDGNQFGINSQYLAGTILGVQKKAKASVDAATTSDKGAQEAAEGSDMRFVAVLDTEILQGADDYGFVLAKVGSGKNTTNTNFDNLKAHFGNGEKTVSAKDTYNNICGNEKYGDPTDDSTSYKYVTCAVNGVDDSSKIVARFYVVKDGKTYYAKYAGYNYQYRGVTAGLADLED